MKIEDVKWLHVEPSSNCNAWCPACPRNKNGFGLANDLIEQDLSIERFQDIVEQLPVLEAVQFCGNYGDPIISSNIIDLIKIAKQHSKKIQIHTNGSLRTTAWWAELAKLLSDIDHNVWFGIDGLAGVHEIYRQGTSYQKIIDNAQAFIGAGGTATWQFIPYAHNEHQIKDCIKTSQRLGFKNFKLVKLYRNKKLAKHYRTGNEFELLPPTEFQQLIRMPKKNTYVDPDDCMHLSQPGIYLSANGRISTCCYFASIESFDTVEKLLYNKVNLAHYQCLENCGS
jgi:sulfatase maturation enzyme AslB (radical SAM superfamily)